MYAIVEIAGQQFKVQKDQKVFVHRLAAEAGEKMEFDRVLLVDNDGKITLGAPAIEGAKVTATVIDHVKGEMVTVSSLLQLQLQILKHNHPDFQE
jgi:large subunit ribosomal protein L21